MCVQYYFWPRLQLRTEKYPAFIANLVIRLQIVFHPCVRHFYFAFSLIWWIFFLILLMFVLFLVLSFTFQMEVDPPSKSVSFVPSLHGLKNDGVEIKDLPQKKFFRFVYLSFVCSLIWCAEVFVLSVAEALKLCLNQLFFGSQYTMTTLTTALKYDYR